MKTILCSIAFAVAIGDFVIYWGEGAPYGQLAGIWLFLGILVYGVYTIDEFLHNEFEED